MNKTVHTTNIQGPPNRRLPLALTDGRGDPVGVRVEESAHLREVTVSLDGIIKHRGLHQEGVVTLQHLQEEGEREEEGQMGRKEREREKGIGRKEEEKEA